MKRLVASVTTFEDFNFTEELLVQLLQLLVISNRLEFVRRQLVHSLFHSLILFFKKQQNVLHSVLIQTKVRQMDFVSSLGADSGVRHLIDLLRNGYQGQHHYLNLRFSLKVHNLDLFVLHLSYHRRVADFLDAMDNVHSL